MIVSCLGKVSLQVRTIVERVYEGLAILKPDNGLGSRIHAGAAKLGKAYIAQAAENGSDGKVVRNNQGIFRSGDNLFNDAPGTLL